MHRTLVVSVLVSAATLAHADKPNRVVDGDSLGVVTFAPGSARITDVALDRVEDIAIWHAEHPDSLLFIEGHASRRGSWTKNLRISQQRTDAVRAALVQAGADPNRLVLVAHGDNQVNGAKRSNHRVVIRARGDFVALAREQRDPIYGEDARAARRTTADQRSRGNVGGDPAGGGAAGGGGAGNTVVIVPGGGAGGGATGAAGGGAADGTGGAGGGAGGAGQTSGGAGASAQTGIGIDPTDGSEAPNAGVVGGTGSPTGGPGATTAGSVGAGGGAGAGGATGGAGGGARGGATGGAGGGARGGATGGGAGGGR